MPRIFVTPLSAVLDSIRAYRPSHLVTLLSPENMIETPPDFEQERHLRLGLNDIADPSLGAAPPAARHIVAIDCLRPRLGLGRERRCWFIAGQASAAPWRPPITLLCDRAGPGSEYEIAQAMRGARSHAQPNRLLVRLADALAGTGRAHGARGESHGPGEDWSTKGFRWNCPLDHPGQ